MTGIARPLTLGALIAVLLAGCAHVPVTHYYVLDLHARPSSPPGPSPERDGLEVGVLPFRVDPPYDQDRIVYRVGHDSAEIGFYPYDRWAMPLSRLLPLAVAGVLGRAAGITSMEPSAPGRRYTALLEGRLVALEEIDTPGGQSMRLQLDLSLRGQDGTVLWSEGLSTMRDAKVDDVGEVAEAMRAALGSALEDARGRLERTLAHRE